MQLSDPRASREMALRPSGPEKLQPLEPNLTKSKRNEMILSMSRKDGVKEKCLSLREDGRKRKPNLPLAFFLTEITYPFFEGFKKITG